MITPEQVADLKVGDVIRLNGPTVLNGATVEGPLYDLSGALAVGNGFEVRRADGSPAANPSLVLAIVSRAPRPLYSNHPRTEPARGDVARGPNGALFHYLGGSWRDQRGDGRDRPGGISLVLLVDGTTGQTVS